MWGRGEGRKTKQKEDGGDFKTWQPSPGFLPAESPWTEEPGGLQSVGVAKSRTRLSKHIEC